MTTAAHALPLSRTITATPSSASIITIPPAKRKKPCCSPCRMRSKTAEQSLQTPSSATAFCSCADERGEYAYCPRGEQQRRIKFLKQNKTPPSCFSMGWEVKDGDVPETTEPEPELPVLGTSPSPHLSIS